jgi:N12 class adenine-specific DNA methylase
MAFFSKIALNDWDAVIMPHSSFGKLAQPLRESNDIVTEELKSVRSALTAGEETGKRNGGTIVRRLQKKKRSLETKLEKLSAQLSKDPFDFEHLGIDAIFVDESQAYKNLFITTRQQVAGLGTTEGSQRAYDLYLKCRNVLRRNGGRGVFFMTGTPVSNSLTEVFTLQRYLQPDRLKMLGLS